MVFNNKAMVYAGAGVCAVIGTLSPVCTAVISSCCGRRLSLFSWAGVLVAFLGALVISWGEVSAVDGSENKSIIQAMWGLRCHLSLSSLSGLDLCLRLLVWEVCQDRDLGLHDGRAATLASEWLLRRPWPMPETWR